MLISMLSMLIQVVDVGGWELGPNERTYSFDGIPNVTFVYYDVYGTTSLEIRRSMEAHAGLGQSDTGRVYGALTKPYVGWNGLRETGPKGCRITKLDMIYRVSVTLPRLANRAAVPPDTLRRWDSFMAKLISHEAGHAHNAYDHLDEIRAAILKGGCQHGNEAGTALVRRDQQRDHDYELATDYGARQGASFP